MSTDYQKTVENKNGTISGGGFKYLKTFMPPGTWLILGFVMYGIIDQVIIGPLGEWTMPWFLSYPLAYIAWFRSSNYVYQNLRLPSRWFADTRQMAQHSIAIAALFGLTKVAQVIMDNTTAVIFFLTVLVAIGWTFFLVAMRSKGRT